MIDVRRAALGFAALLASLAAAACGAGTAAPERPAPASASEAEEIEALWHARLDSARAAHTEADVRFMRGMIHHHAQALEMTELVPADASPSLKTLAARITNSQKDEIATMSGWLQDRGLAVPEIHPTGHHGAGMHMPGMLDAAQMRELADARGTGFDRLFLRYMIQHHQGAVVMVHDLFATDGAAQDEAVFKFASDVQVDQSTEVARMERMLAALPAGDAP